MTLQEYVKVSLRKQLNEGLQSTEISKAIDNLKPLLSSEELIAQGKGLYVYDVYKTLSIYNDTYLAVLISNGEGQGAGLLWKMGDTQQIDSVIFTDDIVKAYTEWANDECSEWKMKVEAAGAPLDCMVGLVACILRGEHEMSPAGVAEHRNDSGETIEDLEKRLGSMYSKIKYANRMRYPNDDGLQQEYQALSMRIQEYKRGITEGVIVCEKVPCNIEKWQDWLDRQLSDAYETRFSRTLPNIINDLKGTNAVSVLLGAVQKTATILGALKNAGLEYSLFQGIANDANLYRNLASNREPGQVLIYNDCDSLLKSLAGVNINGTNVSWEKSGHIYNRDGSEDEFYVPIGQDKKAYPGNFEYQGNRLIITDLAQDEINPAHLKGANTYDISRPKNEVLELIISILPDLCSGCPCCDLTVDVVKRMLDENAPLNLSVLTFVEASQQFMSTCDVELAKARARIVLTPLV